MGDFTQEATCSNATAHNGNMKHPAERPMGMSQSWFAHKGMSAAYCGTLELASSTGCETGAAKPNLP
jgi:hypothetical protein